MVDLNPHLLLVLLVKRCSHRGKQHGRASKSYRELGHVCVCVCVCDGDSRGMDEQTAGWGFFTAIVSL